MLAAEQNKRATQKNAARACVRAAGGEYGARRAGEQVRVLQAGVAEKWREARVLVVRVAAGERRAENQNQQHMSRP